jgi:solute carrier family 25 (peroxisomal adenine nucleotide transporter), member 17
MSEETIISEVVAASLGGAISASILYPLEVIKTKMQAGVTISDDDNSDNENMGEGSSLSDKNDGSSSGKKSEDSIDRQEMIPSEKKNIGMIQFAMNLYRTDGYSVFVRGIETSAFQSALEKALYFLAYTTFKDWYYTYYSTTSMNTITNLALGCAAEWAHLPITLPVDAWTTRIQTSKEAPMKILLSMLSTDKPSAFYKGLSAYYLLCFKPALQYTIYEQVKKLVIQNRRKNNYQQQNGYNSTESASLSSIEAFVLGMVARAISTILVFPFIRAKVLLQARKKSSPELSDPLSDSNTAATTPTTMDVLQQEWNQSGLSGLFQGLGPELTRGVFSSALMLMIKERIAEIVKGLLLPKT